MTKSKSTTDVYSADKIISGTSKDIGYKFGVTLLYSFCEESHESIVFD